MRVLPYGDRAVLIELAAADPSERVLELQGALQAAADGVEELVPAARTLLVRFDPAQVGPDELRRRLAAAPSGPAAKTGATEVVLPVRYDGADLAAVAAEVGMGIDEVIARHTAPTYTVAFCGFAPGFAYLRGLDPVLHRPRLASPRTSVPAGSVAIAAEFAGVYPRPSPGGWRLLGQTDAPLWDLARTPPALLPPGTRVRFEAR
jgi:KipI family sensor histidine kinase inhibitor